MSPLLSARQRAAKRAVDLTIALTLLPLALVLCGLAALLACLFSCGPVLYRQQRVGFGGRTFVLYKLRTMIVDAERATGPTLASPDDPRLTFVGKWLKRFHLDELPQLWNVIRGDMTLVGPRPDRPVFVDQFSARITSYDRRHRLVPGITGLAQLEGTYASSAEEKLRFDLAYGANWSVLLDLKLLGRTPFAILSRSGASLGHAMRCPRAEAQPVASDGRRSLDRPLGAELGTTS